jgi:hypothetical protein
MAAATQAESAAVPAQACAHVADTPPRRSTDPTVTGLLLQKSIISPSTEKVLQNARNVSLITIAPGSG